jgi:hypothetical protein
MQQPMFRDALWAVVESSDRGVGDVEEAAYREMTSSYPDLTRTRFAEIVEVLVRTEHLRRWKAPTDRAGNPAGPNSLMPTSKARLQFAAAFGVD